MKRLIVFTQTAIIAVSLLIMGDYMIGIIKSTTDTHQIFVGLCLCMVWVVVAGGLIIFLNKVVKEL